MATNMVSGRRQVANKVNGKNQIEDTVTGKRKVEGTTMGQQTITTRSNRLKTLHTPQDDRLVAPATSSHSMTLRNHSEGITLKGYCNHLRMMLMKT
jgi:hypothetical protein